VTNISYAAVINQTISPLVINKQVEHDKSLKLVRFEKVNKNEFNVILSGDLANVVNIELIDGVSTIDHPTDITDWTENTIQWRYFVKDNNLIINFKGDSKELDDLLNDFKVNQSMSPYYKNNIFVTYYGILSLKAKSNIVSCESYKLKRSYCAHQERMNYLKYETCEVNNSLNPETIDLLKNKEIYIVDKSPCHGEEYDQELNGVIDSIHSKTDRLTIPVLFRSKQNVNFN
jgi:hypothetical protein